MIKDALLAQLGFTHFAMKANLDGIDQETSLLRAGSGGNCINWVLGHIVHSRRLFTDHFGADPPLSEEQGKFYGRGAEPLGPGSDCVPFADLVRLLDESQERISGLLKEADDAFLQAPVPKLFQPEENEPRGVAFATVVFHEAYHAGQLGTIRGALGKGGAIQ